MAILVTPRLNLVPLSFLWAGDSGGFNPLSSTTYFSGMFPGVDPSTLQTGIRLTVPFNCVVIAATITLFINGAGSNEAATFAIRANTSTDSTLNNAVTFNSTPNSIFNSTGLSILLSKGDQLQVKLTTPAWGTPPTVVLYQVTLDVQPTSL